MASSMISMQDPTDFPAVIAFASLARTVSWRRRIKIVFSTDHLTWESAFFCVNAKPLSNWSNCHTRTLTLTSWLAYLFKQMTIWKDQTWLGAKPCLYRQDLPRRIRTKDTRLPLQLMLCMRICSASGKIHSHNFINKCTLYILETNS